VESPRGKEDIQNDIPVFSGFSVTRCESRIVQWLSCGWFALGAYFWGNIRQDLFPDLRCRRGDFWWANRETLDLIHAGAARFACVVRRLSI
jgi:hypothetical protein